MSSNERQRLAVVGNRYALDGTSMGLPAGPRFETVIEWPGPHLPAVGDQIERSAGVKWRVMGRRWSHAHELTLFVEEWS